MQTLKEQFEAHGLEYGEKDTYYVPQTLAGYANGKPSLFIGGEWIDTLRPREMQVIEGVFVVMAKLGEVLPDV